MAKGLAILGMVALHLFCRKGELPYTPLIYIGETPLIYYIGLFGDICVPIYCFSSGYAQYLLIEQENWQYIRKIPRRLLKFLENYWIVVLLFSGIGLLSGDGVIPGSVKEFLGNFLLYHMTYNGAWWFVLTYVILTLLSPFVYRLVKSIRWLWIILISGCVYFVAYIFRFLIILSIPNGVLAWVWQQSILVGTSQFAYIVGMVCRKKRIINRLRRQGDRQSISDGYRKQADRLIKVCIAVIPLILFGIHCIEQSLIIAPITGIGTILCFHIWRKPNWLRNVCMFMGRHSTNIWLVHMFFYAVMFDGLVFVAKYPFLVLGLLLLICVGISFFIGFIQCSVNRLLHNIMKGITVTY